MIAGMTRRPRRGMAVVAVLMCLIVLTLIGATLLKLGLVRRQINRDLELRLQAEWLVESGVNRALARAAESDYKGETWRLAAADLGLPERSEQINGQAKSNVDAAIVTIAVDRTGAGARRRCRIRVQADYPITGEHRSRCSQELILDLEPSKAGATP
jgi:Tfp pilus assembly protein PilX